MDELEMLRKMVEEQDYMGALVIIDELDEMAKDDKINKVEAFLLVLLIHLIKQQAEKRTAKSWTRSIDNALNRLVKSNKRRSAGGNYLKPDELKESIEETLSLAVRNASYEAFEGVYSAEQLEKMLDKEAVKQEAFDMITVFGS